MLPFRRSQSRRSGGAPRLLYRRGQIDDGATPRWFHGFDSAGLWYRRRAAGHDADGTVIDAMTKIDGDTIILKRRAGPAPIKFPNSHIGAGIFEVDFRVTADRAALALPVSFLTCHSSPQRQNRHRPDRIPRVPLHESAMASSRHAARSMRGL